MFDLHWGLPLCRQGSGVIVFLFKLWIRHWFFTRRVSKRNCGNWSINRTLDEGSQSDCVELVAAQRRGFEHQRRALRSPCPTSPPHGTAGVEYGIPTPATAKDSVAMRLMEEILAIRPGPRRMARGEGVRGQAVYGVVRVGRLLPWIWWRRFDDFPTPGFPSSRETSTRDGRWSGWHCLPAPGRVPAPSTGSGVTTRGPW